MFLGYPCESVELTSAYLKIFTALQFTCFKAISFFAYVRFNRPMKIMQYNTKIMSPHGIIEAEPGFLLKIVNKETISVGYRFGSLEFHHDLGDQWNHIGFTYDGTYLWSVI